MEDKQHISNLGNTLVTGSTGLVGSHLLFLLTQNGQRVRAIKRSASSADFVKWVFSLYTGDTDKQLGLIDWVDADLLDYQSLLDATRGIEQIYHAGGMVSFNPTDANAIIATNVTGTANLIDACLANGVSDFCHVSSIASLGNPNSEGVIDEQCKWAKMKGQSVYARSKFMGENEVWRGFEHGLRVTIVNPSVILGPGRWNSGSGQLFLQVKKGMPAYTQGIGGYVDVRDVARAMVLLMGDRSINGERFVLNAANISFKELFGLMAKGLGKKPPQFEITPFMANIAYPFIYTAGLLTGKGNAISRANLKSAFTKTFYSANKIEEKLGFKFMPIEETIGFIAKQMNR